MTTVQARVALPAQNDENSALAANQQNQCTPDSITASVGKDAADKTQYAKTVREKLSQEFEKLAALLDQNISDTQLAPTENAGCDDADDTVDVMSAMTVEDDDERSLANSSVADTAASSRVPRYTRSTAAATTMTSSPSADSQRRRNSSRIPVRRQSQSPRSPQQQQEDPDAIDEQIWARVRQRKQPQQESTTSTAPAATTAASRATSVPMRAARLGLRSGGKSAATASTAGAAPAPTATSTATATTTTAATKTMASTRAASPSMRSVSRSRSRARDGLSTEERELQRAALARERLQQRIQRNERNMEQNKLAPDQRSTSNMRPAKEPTAPQSPVSHLTQLRGERHYSSQAGDAGSVATATTSTTTRTRDRSTSRLRVRPTSGDANASCVSTTTDRSSSRVRARPASGQSSSNASQQSISCTESMTMMDDSCSCITDFTTSTFKSRDPPRSTYEFQPPTFATKKPTVAQAPKLHTEQRSQSRSRSAQPTRPGSATSTTSSRTSSDRRMMSNTRESQKAVMQAAPITEPEPFSLQTEARGLTHQQRLQLKMEEERARRRAESRLRAQPMPDLSEPFQPQPSDRTVTECDEFSLNSMSRHERALARQRQIEKEREEEARKAAEFKARPAPPTTKRQGFEARPSSKPISSPEAPRLSSTARAESRRAYNTMAEQEAARKEAERRERLAEKQRREEEELRALRRKSVEEGGMAFKAKGVGEGVRTDDIGQFAPKPVTDPKSPQLRSSSRLRARSVGRPRSIAK